MPYDVFISHSSKDKNIAYSIVAGLENHNIRCFIAPRDINPGEDWVSTISQTIIDVPIMLMVFSKNSNNSREVDNEINLALNHNTVVIPLKIDETSPSLEKEYRLGNVHWLDAPNPLTQQQLSDLLEIIRPLINREITDSRPGAEKKQPGSGVNKPRPMKKKAKLIITISAVAAAVIVFLSIMANLQPGTSPLQSQDPAIKSVLSLSFDNKDDINWFSNQDNMIQQDGYIHIDSVPNFNGGNINYMPENGSVFHVRARSKTCGAVALGPYRLENNPSGPLCFDAVIDDSQQNTSLFTGALNLDGSAFLNMGQWIDYILYTSPEGDRVYALVSDSPETIAYTSYAIPPDMRSLDLFPVIMVFYNQPGEYMDIDSVNIAKGSLQGYLDENLPAYSANREEIDRFLSQEAQLLPDMMPQ